MGKFIDAVQARLNHHKDHIYRERFVPLSVSCNKIEDNRVYELTPYTIDVLWRRDLFILPQDLAQAKANFILELRDVVYGEIRDLALAVERSVLERDDRATFAAVAALLEEVGFD
jgi:hypothetical protein